MLTADKARSATSGMYGGYSPLFLDIKLNNVLVEASKSVYGELWQTMPNKKYPSMPVGFFTQNMGRDQTFAMLDKKPAILVITPGKLMDFLEHRKIHLDRTVKICFDPINALLVYNRHDEHIKELFRHLLNRHRIVALTTTLSTHLHDCFNQERPSSFGRDLYGATYLKDERREGLKWLFEGGRIQFIATNGKSISNYAQPKLEYAVKHLVD